MASEYLIVEFPNEQEEGKSMPIAIISSQWTHEKNGVLHCWWPQYISNLNTRTKSVKCHYEINEKQSVSCPINVKYSTVDYDDALNKMKKLEVDSEIESEVDENQRKKNFTTRTQDFTYSSSDFEDYEPSPSPPQPNLIKAKSDVRKDNLLPKKKYLSLSNVPIMEVNPKCYKDVQSPIQRVQVPESNKCKPVSTTNNITGTEKKKDSCCCEKNLAIMTNMWKEMQKMNVTLSALALVSQSNDSIGVCQIEIPKSCRYQDLQKLNKDLEKNSDVYTKLSRRLGLIGGKDTQETTRNIMSALISHELSLSMNFSGKSSSEKKKDGLASLNNIINLIVGSVRCNPLAEKSTDKEIQTAMINWFRTAGDREGGRIRRLKEKE